MDNNISKIIRTLQLNNIISFGTYNYFKKEHPFSTIYKLVTPENIYYIKQLKNRVGNSRFDLEARLLNEYEALKKYYPIFNETKQFNIPEAIYCSLGDLIMITKELRGESVLSIGRKYASRKYSNYKYAIEVYHNVGVFLNKLHSLETFPYTEDDLQYIMKYIQERLFVGIYNNKQENLLYKYLSSTVSSIRNNLNNYIKNPIHRDFVPGNILYDGNNINVLDFGDYTTDNKYQDLTAFEMMLKRQLENRIKYRKSAIEKLIYAFWDGYGFNCKCKEDKLYKLYMMKNYSIVIATFCRGKRWQMSYETSVGIKNRIINLVEYKNTKRIILKLAEQEI